MEMTKWNIEQKNSEASFKVRKLFITNVIGQMEVFEGQVETETDDFESVNKISFKASVNSIKTDDAKRDEHLKSSDFFNMEKYPYIRFVAEDFNANEKKIQADLTIKDITKSITLAIDSGKTSIGKNSGDRVELSFSGKIDRRDFGLTWDGKNAAGDLIVGDEIKLSAKIQFVKQSQNATAKEIK
ncbi:YceI family protein [Gelidibacter gilvus]|uniref:Polyisoprenoid-binding protein n=1 Tax=Gelidibacter gilvus TaxID=59602 RepID=A0A4Q0XB36_9FLAO|nr:YceI family protein [Gelidibacter gilvus]RXJ44328.1 polyisoprenoid-binding protein [Gelidibacter gilvus]